MSVKSPLGLVLYCYLNMPTINKTYLILSYLVYFITTDHLIVFFFVEGEVARRVILIESRSDKTRNNMTYRHAMYHIEKSSMRYMQ